MPLLFWAQKEWWIFKTAINQARIYNERVILLGDTTTQPFNNDWYDMEYCYDKRLDEF